MAKEVEVDLKVDATQADKALKKFGGTLEDVHGEGVQPLNFAIGELEDRLYEMAAAGNSSSAEFKAMSAEVGKMKKVIIETDLAIDGMAQTTAQTTAGALTGIASGFEFAQGAMGAFGVSGEAVEESLLKVQSAMAMAQGLQGLKEGMIAFKALRQSIMATTVVQKALNFVMNMNPVGLIIAGIVALGAAIAALWNPIKDMLGWMGLISTAESEADHQREVFANMEKARKEEARRQLELEKAAKKRAFDSEQTQLSNQIRLYQAQGKDVTELTRLKIQGAIDSMKFDLKEIEQRLENQRLLRKSLEKTGSKMGKVFKAGAEAAESETKDAVSKMKNDLETLETDLQLVDIEAGKRAKDKSDTAIAENKRKLDEIAKQEAEALKKVWELDNQVRAREAEQKELLRSINATDAENELAELQASYAAKFELAKNNFELTIALRKELSEKEIALAEEQAAKRKELADKEQEQKDADAQADLEREQGVKDAKLNAASTSFQAIGDLANAFAGDSEKSQKKAFKINKAVQMAQAVIATYQGANAIFASAAANPATVAFPAQPFIMAGAAIASGLANVATIAKTKFQGGSTGGSAGGSAPSLPSASSSPTFNVIGDSGTNQLAESLGGPQKAYVVSGDVTTAQSLDRNKIENASI